MMPPHFQRNFCGDFLKNMHFDPQIHPFWWRCGFPMVGKHEFSVGWQQAPHASQWRPNPFTESLRTAVWGLSQVPEAFSRMHLFLSLFLRSCCRTLLLQVGDLQHASPATVSRCAVVFIDPKHLSYTPYWQRWIKNRHEKVLDYNQCVKYSLLVKIL